MTALTVTIAMARPEALGMGGVKLALLVGVGLGWRATRALALGLVLATVIGIALPAHHGPAASRRAILLASFGAAGPLATSLA